MFATQFKECYEYYLGLFWNLDKMDKLLAKDNLPRWLKKKWKTGVAWKADAQPSEPPRRPMFAQLIFNKDAKTIQ